ncbi:MAG: hypothetical protein ACKV22_07685 [Bryobacteraceae bacterium]
MTNGSDNPLGSAVTFNAKPLALAGIPAQPEVGIGIVRALLAAYMGPP